MYDCLKLQYDKDLLNTIRLQDEIVIWQEPLKHHI